MSHQKDFPISELRVVRIFWKKSNRPSEHWMHESQVDEFVKATIRLHHTDDNIHFNPPKRLNNLWIIHVGKLNVEARTYWWCSSTLHENHATGAKINTSYTCWGERVWTHPELIAYEKKLEEREDD